VETEVETRKMKTGRDKSKCHPLRPPDTALILTTTQNISELTHFFWGLCPVVVNPELLTVTQQVNGSYPKPLFSLLLAPFKTMTFYHILVCRKK
jgi:hypothetical protein